MERRSALGFLVEDLHGDGHEPLELLIRGARQQCFGPALLLPLRVAIEQAAEKADERDALELRPALRDRDVLLAPQQRLEAEGVAEGLGGQRGDRLAEAYVAVAEWLGVTLGAEEDRPDDGALPADRHDDDGAHVARVERRLDAAKLRVVGGVRNEHGLAAIECPLELRVSVQVDDEIPDRRNLVARHEADLALLPREEDRAPVE